MLKQLAAALLMLVWFLSVSYLAILTNWFQEGLSLEASMVATPLFINAALTTFLTVWAYFSQSKVLLWMGFLAAIIGGGFVVHRQMVVFGEMPSLNMNQVSKSPVGVLQTQKGEVDYWIELKNPFTTGHAEFLMIKQGSDYHTVTVPIFNGPTRGYAEAAKVEDWGKLAPTAKPDLFIFTVNKSLSSAGRFRVNLKTEKAVKMRS